MCPTLDTMAEVTLPLGTREGDSRIGKPRFYHKEKKGEEFEVPQWKKRVPEKRRKEDTNAERMRPKASAAAQQGKEEAMEKAARTEWVSMFTV